MQVNDMNIYKNARRIAGLTQERAAEMLGISVRSIADYETGARLPPNEVVGDMVVVYNNQVLAIQHLRASAACAREVIPEVKQMPLSEAALTLIDAIYDFADSRADRELIEIARDGHVDKEEMPRFMKIMEKLNAIAAAAIAVNCN